VTDQENGSLDIVVFGATSFVGQILCRYLVARHGTDGPLRWAIAGRNRAKLDEVARDTGADVERIVVDAADDAGVAAMVGRTRLVISTVGPYVRYGSPLVAAVAAAGVDYVDLTGEPQWMRRMIDEHQATAERTGARLVHTCGFDSIPSDLGAFFTQQRAVERFGVPCSQIELQVRSMKGSASGGTIASMLELVEEAAADRSVRALLADPYALNPADMRSGPDGPDLARPAKDSAGCWQAPFVMAGVNRKVVHRTNALLGRPWGPDFRYQETMATRPGPLGAAMAGGVAGGLAVSLVVGGIGPLRRAAQRWVLPKPGEGPSPAAQERGHWEVQLVGTTSDGRTLRTRVTGDRDPGYGSTAKMLGESAVTLLDRPAGEPGGGFWTPASALGDALIERLEAHAGLRFDVLDG